MRGHEALIRWQHPSDGIRMPGSFLPVAEQMRIMGEIGKWSIAAACRQVAEWNAAGRQDWHVAVNLSPPQLREVGLMRFMADSKTRYGVRPGQLHIEITEDAFIGDVDWAVGMVSQMNEIGISVALDDFGTRYSSLTLLSRLPVDQIKIDRSFVQDVHRHVRNSAIVSSVVALARNLRMQVTAEGVECAAEYDFLRRSGCAFAQGYLIARPSEAGALTGTTAFDAATWIGAHSVDYGNAVLQ